MMLKLRRLGVGSGILSCIAAAMLWMEFGATGEAAQPASPPPAATAAGDCFTPSGTPGCTDACIQAAVCAVDSFCCAVAWDSICVGEATSIGCPSCPGSCGGGGPGDCFTATASPGCTDACIQAAVCAADPFCCATSWDSICVGEAASIGTPCDCDVDATPDVCEPDCDADGTPDDCELDGDGNGIPDDCDACNLHVVTDCFSTHGPGCSEPCIEASVCAADPFCCATAWDSICASEAISIGTPCDCDASGIPDVCEGSTSAQVIRAGTPPNPLAFLPDPAGGPILGGTWSPFFDHTSFLPGSLLDLILVSPSPVNIVLPGYGTLLCTLPASPIIVSVATPGTFAIPVPFSCGAMGITLCTQGGSTDGVSFALANALDVTLGLL
jgi:hypothetical protein